ncbi:hypothetical protein [Dyadobacter sp. CY326]|uniref:hypothetical protein n=1 Tax=Dyadobacter sp. CY326 TaxID=2907300 RepID=UPI001F3EE86E|nr:hypothetical protein [Dyadobacter sp. CY326]MCE7065767.1 hypothetical protein [Dyadobacter sp. CY326]
MDSDNFRELWNKQIATPAPSKSELLKRAVKLKNENRNRVLLSWILLIATAATILFMVKSSKPESLTTKIGIGLIFLSIVFYLVASADFLRLLIKDANRTLNVSAYLNLLLIIKERQLRIGTVVMTWYFILLSCGLLIYIYEFAIRMPRISGVAVFAATGLWILINWFYLKPMMVKKQQTKLIEMIDSLEKLSRQLPASNK